MAVRAITGSHLDECLPEGMGETWTQKVRWSSKTELTYILNPLFDARQIRGRSASARGLKQTIYFQARQQPQTKPKLDRNVLYSKQHRPIQNPNLSPIKNLWQHLKIAVHLTTKAVTAVKKGPLLHTDWRTQILLQPVRLCAIYSV